MNEKTAVQSSSLNRPWKPREEAEVYSLISALDGVVCGQCHTLARCGNSNQVCCYGMWGTWPQINWQTYDWDYRRCYDDKQIEQSTVFNNRKVPAHTIYAMLHSSMEHNYAVTMSHSTLRTWSIFSHLCGFILFAASLQYYSSCRR